MTASIVDAEPLKADLVARVRRHPLMRVYGRFVRRFAFWLLWQMTRFLWVRTIAEVPPGGIPGAKNGGLPDSSCFILAADTAEQYASRNPKRRR